MFRILMICVAFVSLSACKPSDKAIITQGESLLKATLKDPDSARFSSFYKPSGDGYGYVCGKLNAKDGQGIYTGSKPYYVYVETVDGKLTKHAEPVLVKLGDSEELNKYRLFCQ